MDRMLVFAGQVALPVGHRVEVSELVDPQTDEPVVLSLLDLDTGIRYRRAEEPRAEVTHWIGRVLDCTVAVGVAPRTSLLLDPIGPSASGAGIALRGADEAVNAAKAEADRWGGSDRPPPEEPERFW
ncbi:MULTISPECIES: hypothetical protein [unclassified Microbacterium]|uniref:hypothetical protein n=1 Tax=unclassified Microbacterium TaxID=2609290 RepID=UPI0021A298F1|nr:MULTISPECIES: hypothetical protein [unclassified Microbacterium]MCT1365887.1 hypothetical protein [Microbacterium sp. p3-SID131]MCT1376860.1 hypothetical protein [Microbacterium sp. p3-SID337]